MDRGTGGGGALDFVTGTGGGVAVAVVTGAVVVTGAAVMAGAVVVGVGVAGLGVSPRTLASLACLAASRSSAAFSAALAFSAASARSLASRSSTELSGVGVTLGAISPNRCCLSSSRRAASARMKAWRSSGVIFLVNTDGEGVGAGERVFSTVVGTGGAAGGVRA